MTPEARILIREVLRYQPPERQSWYTFDVQEEGAPVALTLIREGEDTTVAYLAGRVRRKRGVVIEVPLDLPLTTVSITVDWVWIRRNFGLPVQ